MAKILGGRARPMAAMIAGVDEIAGAGQRLSQSRIASAMLGEPMRYLHRRPRRAFRRPAIDLDFGAVVAIDQEPRFLHDVPSSQAYAALGTTCRANGRPTSRCPGSSHMGLLQRADSLAQNARQAINENVALRPAPVSDV